MIVIVLDGLDIVDRMKNIHTCDDSDKLLTHASCMVSPLHKICKPLKMETFLLGMPSKWKKFVFYLFPNISSSSPSASNCLVSQTFY